MGCIAFLRLIYLNMKLVRILLLIAALAGAATKLYAAEEASLDPHLEPLRPWLGMTWKGELKDAKTGKISTDIARWDRALNGKAVRILHSVDAGSYGGETIVRWDEKKNTVVYHYFTTGDFITVGTMTFNDRTIISHEEVAGGAGGVTQVRGTTTMGADGSFQVKTEYMKDGNWEIARETTYREDAAGAVVFK